LQYYVTESADAPFIAWLESLKDAQVRYRIKERLTRVELGILDDHKAVGSGVFELRLQFSSDYRIYNGEEGEKVILLLCGGDKSSQKKDIKHAIAYWNDYQAR